MAEGETPQSSTETVEGETPEVSGESTPEAIEAYWRNRISGSDRAHAAEAKALRERIAALEGVSPSPAPEGGQPAGDVQAATELAERLQKELLAERAARVVDTRTAKYPDAAAALGDAAVLASMDEGRLASLNESLRPASQPRPVGANNPARSQSGPKALADMSIEELRAHLRTLPAPSVD